MIFLAGFACRANSGVRVDRYPPFVAQSWFPLVEGSRYWYSGQFQGKTYQDVFTVVRHRTPFGPLFYFADELMKDPTPSLSANMFGLAGYTTTKTEVLTIPATYLNGFQREESAHAQTLLRLPLVIGASTELRDDGTIVQLTVAGRESVTVPAGTFKDCARIEIHSQINSTKESSTVWLAEGVGLIKWSRATGRVDELTKYQR